MSNIPRLPALRRAAVEVLAGLLRPVHYADLAEQVISHLGVSLSRKEQAKCKEDLREKVLEAGHGADKSFVYIGEPHCLVALAEWVRPNNYLLNTGNSGIQIPANLQLAIDAATESHMRAPFMQTKYANTMARWRGLVQGLIIERHVSDWFRQQWPEFWQPPDNEGLWHQWCDHDFKLAIPQMSKPQKVDVLGPKQRTQLYGFPATGKHEVDIHIAARADGAHIIIDGWMNKARLGILNLDGVHPEQILSPASLVARLNCYKSNLPWTLLASSRVSASVSLSRQDPYPFKWIQEQLKPSLFGVLPMPPCSDKPSHVLTVRDLGGPDDPPVEIRLRHLLKNMLRRYRLQCLAIRQVPDPIAALRAQEAVERHLEYCSGCTPERENVGVYRCRMWMRLQKEASALRAAVLAAMEEVERG